MSIKEFGLFGSFNCFVFFPYAEVISTKSTMCPPDPSSRFSHLHALKKTVYEQLLPQYFSERTLKQTTFVHSESLKRGERVSKNPVNSEIAFTIFYSYFDINAGACKKEQT